ncbi:hypothetical protein B0H19DRAFT_512312 [Mycena capillaripes]|nr:hypothetical protein B0H19DRAFT_512312 [Mycena capillaripes]
MLSPLHSWMFILLATDSTCFITHCYSHPSILGLILSQQNQWNGSLLTMIRKCISPSNNNNCPPAFQPNASAASSGVGTNEAKTTSDRNKNKSHAPDAPRACGDILSCRSWTNDHELHLDVLLGYFCPFFPILRCIHVQVKQKKGPVVLDARRR